MWLCVNDAPEHMAEITAARTEVGHPAYTLLNKRRIMIFADTLREARGGCKA